MRTTAVIAVACLLFLSACGGAMSIYVRGLDPMNRNEKGESTPIDILIVQLKDDQKFKDAQWETLWEPKKSLPDDTLDVKTYTVFPGKPDDDPKRVDLGELNADCRFIGIVAKYEPQGEAEGPRHVVLEKDDADEYVFEFKDYKIILKD